MIRRISSLALGIAVTFAAAGAFAQEEGGDKPAEGGDKPAEGAAGGEAKAGGAAAVSTDSLPASKGAFGKSGQIAISSDFSLGFQSISIKPPQGDSQSGTVITFAPALDYFVADSISVGGQLTYRSSKIKDGPESSEIGIGPRVGYNLGLAEKISLWPKVGFEYNMQTTKGATGGESKATTMSLGVMAPVLYHPAEHFFIGLGPVFSMDLSSKVKPDGADETDGAKTTVIGLDSVVGGWF
ncbi:MAG: outer membrane beta-barrel protein [Polyangiaceae bacterium]